MFNKIDDNTVQIKVYKNFDWVWLNVKLRNQDIKYIQKNCYLLKELSPALEKKPKRVDHPILNLTQD